MITKVNGYTFMCCDGCEDRRRLGRGVNFTVQVREAVKVGWKVLRDAKTWKHFCRDCEPEISACHATDDLFAERSFSEACRRDRALKKEGAR